MFAEHLLIVFALKALPNHIYTNKTDALWSTCKVYICDLKNIHRSHQFAAAPYVVHPKNLLNYTNKRQFENVHINI